MKLLIVLGLLPFFSASPFPPYSLPYGGFDLSNTKHFDLGQVRNMAEILVADLKALNADPNSAKIINKIFKNNNKQCLRDMNDAIIAIEDGVRLVDEASGDIMSLVVQVESMIGLKDEAQILKIVATIMRTLPPLLNKISPKNPASQVCRSSTDNTFSYLRSLAVLLEEFSDNPDLAITHEMQRMLVYSGSVLSGVTAFLYELESNTKELTNSCSGDRLSGMRAVKALGKIMLNLADMVSTLGGLANGKEIRDGGKVVERIVVS